MNMPLTKIDQLICVCSKQDTQTWTFVSPCIVRNIYAKHYKIFVPDAEVELFKANSAKSFEVIGGSVEENTVSP